MRVQAVQACRRLASSADLHDLSRNRKLIHTLVLPPRRNRSIIVTALHAVWAPTRPICNPLSLTLPRADRQSPRRLAAEGGTMCTRYTSVLVLLIAGVVASPAWPAQGDGQKMGPLARERALLLTGSSRVIVQATDSAAAGGLANAIGQAGGRAGRALSLIDARVADVPNTALAALANNPVVARISLDRPVLGSLERTGATVGATAVRQNLGLDGSGITVAIIDSGIMPSHDDLAGPNGPRVLAFVDYVNGRTLPYDDYGHGTHVAGIAAGNGFDSGGARTGIAPAANLVALKVLDASGTGTISNVIAALGYAVTNRNALHIRIVNLSVSAGVYESYNTDPLTLAARHAVNAGLVVPEQSTTVPNQTWLPRAWESNRSAIRRVRCIPPKLPTCSPEQRRRPIS